MADTWTSRIYKAITGTDSATPRIGSAGSVGKDFSINAPVLPTIGSNFAAAGPYASYVLIKTIAADNTRNNIEVKNLTGAQIVILRDDGTAASSAAPLNASVFAIAGGASAGQQGGAWSSMTFRGRLQIFAQAALSGNAYVSVSQD